jgi:hypothetical protein
MRKNLRTALVLATMVSFWLSLSSRLPAQIGGNPCGAYLPFTDVVGNAFLCQIAEAYLSGLTNGTSATTYNPSANVTREQMAAFITRTQDSALRRGSRRAALKQWATPSAIPPDGTYFVGGSGPRLVEADGADIWVADISSGDVKRVRASDGSLLGTWTGATAAFGVLVAHGKVYVTGQTSPGRIYQVNPQNPPGAIVGYAGVAPNPTGITTDGDFIWTANLSGSVTKMTFLGEVFDTRGTGFVSPVGILFDGTNIWVTDLGDNQLKKLNSDLGILQSVQVGAQPNFPVFDGSNIWVPNNADNTLTVVRARDGVVIATLTGNGLNQPSQAAFDGERILVTNFAGDSVSMWNAANLGAIGSFSAAPGAHPLGVCSDGINFWIALYGANKLARF